MTSLARSMSRKKSQKVTKDKNKKGFNKKTSFETTVTEKEDVETKETEIVKTDSNNKNNADDSQTTNKKHPSDSAEDEDQATIKWESPSSITSSHSQSNGIQINKTESDNTTSLTNNNNNNNNNIDTGNNSIDAKTLKDKKEKVDTKEELINDLDSFNNNEKQTTENKSNENDYVNSNDLIDKAISSEPLKKEEEQQQQQQQHQSRTLERGFSLSSKFAKRKISTIKSRFGSKTYHASQKPFNMQKNSTHCKSAPVLNVTDISEVNEEPAPSVRTSHPELQVNGIIKPSKSQRYSKVNKSHDNIFDLFQKSSPGLGAEYIPQDDIATAAIQKVGRKMESLVFSTILDAREVLVLRAIFKTKKVLEGTQLAKAGEEATMIFFVGSGRLKCVLNDEFLFHKNAGDFFNNELFVHALTCRPYSNPFDIIATTTTEITYCTIEDLLKFTAKPKNSKHIPSLSLFARSTLLSMVPNYITPKNTLEHNHLAVFYESFRHQYYQKSKTLFRNGELKRELFVVISGAVKEYIDYGSTTEQLVTQYGPGQIFGEYSLFMSIPQTNTAIAVDNTIVYNLTGERFENFIKLVPSLHETWRETFESKVKKDVIVQLKRLNVPFLKDFDDDNFEQLEEMAKVKSYLTNDYIFVEGEENPKYFYLIAKGSCFIEVNGEHVGILHENENFGEKALVSDKPRQATVIAAKATVVLVIETAQFSKLFMKLPSVVAHIKAHLDPLGMSIHDIINHSDVFEIFKKHVIKECSEENIKFLHDVAEYNKLLDGDKNQIVVAREIYEKYIEREKSAYSINVPQVMVNTVQQIIENDKVNSLMFSECVEATLNLMSTDSLLRFKTSSAFKAYVNSVSQKQAAQ